MSFSLVSENIDEKMIQKLKEEAVLSSNELIELYLFYRTAFKTMLKLGAHYKIVADTLEKEFETLVILVEKRSMLEFVENLYSHISMDVAPQSDISVKFISMSAEAKSDEWKIEGASIKSDLKAEEAVLSVNYKSLGKTIGFYVSFNTKKWDKKEDFNAFATKIKGVKDVHDIL